MSSDLSDLRALIADRLGGVAAEKVDALIERAFEVEKKAWGHCPNCNQSVQVAIPDVVACTKALATLTAEGFGKPKETFEHEIALRMSLEEVRAAKEQVLAALAREGA